MDEHVLVKIGRQKYEASLLEPRKTVDFLQSEEENLFLNDLDKYPHAFVLASLMDRQIKAEKAWHIPYQIKEILGGFEVERLSEISLLEYVEIFNDHKLHRFNDDMADIFYSGVNRIKNHYAGDVSKIWKNNPSSARVVYEFLQFKGAGVKLATMMANILVRDFHIEMSDYYSIDISPDVHVMRIMSRLGLIENKDDKNGAIYKARELNPTFPGIIDYSCWEIGRKWCHPQAPDCDSCILRSECQKQS